MTIAQATKLVRTILGPRMRVTYEEGLWAIYQWTLTDSCYKRERLLGVGPSVGEALTMAIPLRRVPWGVALPLPHKLPSGDSSGDTG